MKRKIRFLAIILVIAVLISNINFNYFSFNAVENSSDPNTSISNEIELQAQSSESSTENSNEDLSKSSTEDSTKSSTQEESTIVDDSTEKSEESTVMDEKSTEKDETLADDQTTSDNVMAPNTGLQEGYHYGPDGKVYGNMYIFKYSPNNGSSEYEQENHGYTYPNQIFSRHFWNHVSEYDGIPVYNSTQEGLEQNGGLGGRDEDYYVDDLTVVNNVFDRDNYNFVNWNTNPDGSGRVYTNKQSVNNEYSENLYEQILYAQWEIAETSVVIQKNSGTFSIDEFEKLNNLTKTSTENGVISYTLSDGSTLTLKETTNEIELTANCLTTIKIPDIKSPNASAQFVGYETDSDAYNANTKEFFFEDKNSKPSLKALFLSDLELKGTVDLKGYNGQGSVFLSWGTSTNDDIEKVYKIARSLDGTNFEYIPDNNLSDLIEGKKYSYTGDVQTFTAPVTGKYFIQAYGGNGGIGFHLAEDAEAHCGYGGYASGYVDLQKGQTIYLYVGQAGGTYNTSRTYGGGGAAPVRNKIWSTGLADNWREHAPGRGGGASYVSLTNTPLSSYIGADYTSMNIDELHTLERSVVEKAKQYILLVAAGGSGSGDHGFGYGADGGGLVGAGTVVSDYHYGTVNSWTTTGATQTSAGYGDYGTINGMADDYYYRTTTYGTFFYGSNGMSCSGAAGGGWFGGGMCYVTGGSGASSYLGTSLGLHDAKTTAGGNKVNSADSFFKYNVNGSIVIKCCEYWITTNTAENVYSPDTAAPSDPSNINVSLDANNKGTITWDSSVDSGTDYWYRVDAFDAKNHDTKISETEVQKFNVTSGVKGYLYIIDGNKDTEAHQGNSTLTTETSLSDIDILDVGEARYLHVAAIDEAGNVSNTKTVLLNKTTISVNPNEKGKYNNSYDIQNFIVNANETYNLSNIVTNENQVFLGWKQTTGDGLLNTSKNTVTAGFAKTTIVADYMAELILKSTPNYTANSKKGAIDLSWEQNDSLPKKYKLYQSTDGQNWYDAAIISNNGGNNTKTYTYNSSTSYYTYTVPYSGTYTLSVKGSKGQSYGNYAGGNGSAITGQFELKKGDVLYIYCGGEGTNGGGSANYGKGGGATDIRLNGTALSNRILVAAGGGGANVDKAGGVESSSPSHNSILGNGSSGSAAGGGGGYYGGNKGDYTSSTQYLSDAIGNRQGTYSIGGFARYAHNSNGYCYSATANYGQKPINQGYVIYNNVWWKVCAYKNSSQNPGNIVFMKNDYGSGNNCYVNIPFYPNSGDDSGFCNTCEGVNMYHPRCNNHWDAYRTVYSSTASTAGTSWIDLNKGTRVGNVSYGTNATTGSATITFDQSAVGELQTNSISGIVAKDLAAPNAPFGGNISSVSGSTAVLTWAKPEDNGTKYYHKAESYNSTTNQKLRTSNITEDVITTGVKEYRYYADASASGTVTLSNSTVVSTNQIPVSTSTLANYYHIAAVDYAGNIGPTYTFQPRSYASVAVTVNWVDDNNAHATRPNSNVTISLYRNGGSTPVSTKTLSSYSTTENVVFDNLNPLDGNGNAYKYTVSISGVTSKDKNYSYSSSINGLTITNTLSHLTKDVTVNVNWEDNNNGLGTRPDTITVNIVDEAGKVIDSKTVNSSETKIIFKDVPGDKTYHITVGDVTSKKDDNEYKTTQETTGDNFNINNILKYNIKVNPNGGTWNNSKDTQSFLKEKNETISLPDPTRQGYIFTGWKLTPADGVSISNKTITVGTQNVEVKATWKKATLTLSVNPNGGIFDTSSDITTYEMDYNTKRLINVPTREGYTFKTWTITGAGASMANPRDKSMFTIGYEDATLTAVWENNTIKVKLDANGGTVNPGSINVKYDAPYGELPTPSKTGYDFIEWTTDKEGTDSVTKDTIVKNPEDHTLYAQYKIKQTSISGKVVWVDNNNEHKSRPSELKINILSDGEFYQWVEKDKKDGAYTISTSDTWTFFKENLQEYNVTTGKKINYSVILSPNPAKSMNKQYAYKTTYSVASDGTFVITNTEYRATKTISGSVNWVDKSNAYKSRPDSVVVELYQDGKKVDSTTVKGTGNSWTYKFEDWLIYKDDGKEHTYTVNVNPNPVKSKNTDDAYKTVIKDYVITNTLINNNKKVINGTVNWKDNNDKLGYRPKDVTVILYQNGKKLSETKVTVDNSGNLDKFAFNNLPKYDNSMNLYNYTVSEVLESSYLVINSGKNESKDAYSIAVKNFDITNTLNIKDNENIIPVKPQYDNTITLKHNVNEKVSVSLKQLGTIYNNGNISYSNTYNGIFYNVEAEKLGTTISGLASGKYEISINEDYTLNNITISNNNNIHLEKEGGKYYIIIDDVPRDTSATVTIDLSKTHEGYKSSYRINNFWKID